jgi:methylmalonyl-CoA mutase
MAAEYVAQYAQNGLQPADIFKAISFRFPISTDFFGEIAKFRAFRMLWAKFLRAYQLDPSDPAFAQVNATGSRRQMASLDIPTNILRSSTQAMSAVLGGCDSVSVPAFDELTAAPNSLSMRLSANLQRVLRFEAAFDKVIDPAGGAYFVELLTEQLAAKSWAHFQTMESAGGYLAYLQGGTLRTELQAASNALHSQINKGRVTLLGVNQYPDLENVAAERGQEAPLGELNSESAWATALGVDKSNRVQALQSLLEMEQSPLSGLWPVMRDSGRVAHGLEIGERDSSDFENLRSLTQHLASPPKAFLFAFGDLAMRQARAGFARNLLGTAGIAAKLNAFPDDTAQAMAAAIALKPNIVVLCSADAQYFSDAPVLLQQLKSALPDCRVVLAGKPEGWESLRGNGLDACIFMGMDRLAWLNEVVMEMKLKKGATHAS